MSRQENQVDTATVDINNRPLFSPTPFLANPIVPLRGEGVPLQKECLGSSAAVEVHGKIIRLNSKELREKYRDYPRKHLMTMGGKKCAGGGSNRLERYRIPDKLIEGLLACVDDDEE